MINKQIIAQIKSGNIQTFELLYLKYYKRLCAFVNKYINDYEESKEIVQDVFYTLWVNRNTLDNNKSVSSFLFKLAQNKSLNMIRRRRIEDKYKNFLSNFYINQISTDPINSLLANEIQIKSQEIIDNLPLKCREIYLMSRHEGLKYKEIANELEISVKTVETQIGKALKIFRKELKDYISCLCFLIIKFF